MPEATTEELALQNAASDSASAVTEQAATEMETLRDNKLKELGPQLAKTARALVKRVTDAQNFANEVSLLLLQARSVCYRTVTSKHPDYKDKDAAQQRVFVRDWDGRSQEYRDWFARHFWSVMSEFVVEEVPADDLAKLSKDAEGNTLPDAIVKAAPTGKAILRSIEYRISENRPSFVSEVAGDAWEDELKHLGLDLDTPSAKARARRGGTGTTSDNGVPQETQQTERIIAKVTKGVALTKDDDGKVTGVENTDGLVLAASHVVMGAKKLDELLTIDIIDAMPKADLRRLVSAIGSAQNALDSISKRLPS